MLTDRATIKSWNKEHKKKESVRNPNVDLPESLVNMWSASYLWNIKEQYLVTTEISRDSSQLPLKYKGTVPSYKLHLKYQGTVPSYLWSVKKNTHLQLKYQGTVPCFLWNVKERFQLQVTTEISRDSSQLPFKYEGTVPSSRTLSWKWDLVKTTDCWVVQILKLKVQ